MVNSDRPTTGTHRVLKVLQRYLPLIPVVIVLAIIALYGLSLSAGIQYRGTVTSGVQHTEQDQSDYLHSATHMVQIVDEDHEIQDRMVGATAYRTCKVGDHLYQTAFPATDFCSSKPLLIDKWKLMGPSGESIKMWGR